MTNLLEVIKRVNQEKAGPRLAPYFRLGLLAVAVLIVAVIYLTSFAQSQIRWRAVFLTNNQVYFGRLFWNPFSSSATLSDIYYLRFTPALQAGEERASTDIKLLKLGSELHGPRDKMIIPKRQILFWEDLKNDSLVVRKINETKKR